MPTDIKRFVLGPLETNCYVLTSGEDCWIVDPGIWPNPLMEYLAERKLTPSQVLLTHGHGDHIDGITALKKEFPRIRICCPEADEPMLRDPWKNLSAMVAMPIVVGGADELLHAGMTLTCGQDDWSVLDTAGHSPGGVSFYCADAGVVLTGDALFAGSIGRVDIPGADGEGLLSHIRDNLLTLPGDTRVLPGHGPETTIQAEREGNPFLQTCPDATASRRAEIDRRLSDF